MTTPLKTIATKYSKYLTPKRLLFRSSDNLQSLGQVREVFKQLGKYGEMAEYKVMRCPETFQYLNYGFIVYKNSQDADKAMKDKFIKIQPSDVFNEPFEISLHLAERDGGNTLKKWKHNSNKGSDRFSDNRSNRDNEDTTIETEVNKEL